MYSWALGLACTIAATSIPAGGTPPLADAHRLPGLQLAFNGTGNNNGNGNIGDFNGNGNVGNNNGNRNVGDFNGNGNLDDGNGNGFTGDGNGNGPLGLGNFGNIFGGRSDGPADAADGWSR